jgi:hypothetical protein
MEAWEMELFLVIVLLWLRVQNSILSPLKSELGISAITIDNWLSVCVPGTLKIRRKTGE